MFDTHCHLNLEVFKNSYLSVISDAKGAGISQFLVPGTDLEDSKKAVAIAQDVLGVYAAVGIHPTYNLESLDIKKALYQLEELALSSKKVVAIGEIGLDYYKFKSAPRIQGMFFEEQVKIASRLGKSVIIHNRHAAEDLVKILDKNWNKALDFSVVLHCCEADIVLLSFALRKKVFVGVGGDVTYDRKKQEFVKKVPLELLVLETDSPFLTPEPAKSKRSFPNEPKNLVFVNRKVAQIKGVTEKN